jgi:DNA-binding phage protein
LFNETRSGLTAKAHGGVQALATKVNLNPTQLYRTLSPQGNPGLSSLMVILRALGLHLAVRPLGDQAL